VLLRFGRIQPILERLQSQRLPPLLRGDIRLDSLRRYVPGAGRKIASRPQRGEFLQFGVAFTQNVRRDPLARLYHIGRRRSWKCLNKQLHVVGLYRQFKNVPAQLVALLTNQTSAIAGNVADQHLFPALRRPYEVIHDEVYPVLVSLIFHAQPVAALVDSVAQDYASGKQHSAESHFEKPRLTTRAKALWLAAGLSSVNAPPNRSVSYFLSDATIRL